MKGFVTKEVKDSRWSECSNCPELIKATSTCKKCGCFMRVKVTLAAPVGKCPLGKWAN